MKKCFKCGIEKELNCFYVHPQMADGHLNKCIECTKSDALEHRNKNLEQIRAYDRDRAKLPKRKRLMRITLKKYRERHPLRSGQNTRAERAAKNGKITKPLLCEICGSHCTIYGHHKDYSKPLEVVWVCQPCHKELHKTQKVIG